MWKKWFNIFLCIWLVNAVTYFHAANPFEDNNDSQSSVFASAHPKLNTWADCFLHQAPLDDEAIPILPHKINSHRRYVNSRSHSFSIFVSGTFCSSLFTVPKYLLYNCSSNYSIGVAMLPAYYNFLFRFSPF
ncbi:hypothetical protein [Mucilaginibacter polytrichastri]|uniref:Secreted protein n=1 Tax=Mucilaginibacter polytrichastri TaxID=1302689 RepID=A0A1Q6A0R0_9SPHI|nr:hypothetical protein [Mucilaginibacter polytrichastri]OKS87562.1 hypothetical protein RG47T_3023 [Mucilaginibacter polytrichastri]SFS92178.1 hypothetical protein SAMN04487890_106154 [Mucilaginibacter polytrichastri]